MTRAATIGPARAWVLPKAEIHLHIEGCFSEADLSRLAAAAGVALPRPLGRLFEFSDFDGFLDFLSWSCGLVRTADQAVDAARRLSQRLAAAGTRYADVIVNPTHWGAWRTDVGGLIRALDIGFTEAEQDGGPPVGLCISLLRQQSASEANELVDLLVDAPHPRVVALSIDGNERIAGRVSARFAEAFDRAGRAGLRRTVHAGESSGPEGVWDALDVLGADRIDHGVRAIEDPALVAELADRGIALGVCPRSNVVLGLYADIESHPIDELRAAGVRVSINTDDPAFLGTSLDVEYRRTAEAFGWDDEIVRDIARTSIEGSFAPDDVKRSLITELAAW